MAIKLQKREALWVRWGMVEPRSETNRQAKIAGLQRRSHNIFRVSQYRLAIAEYRKTKTNRNHELADFSQAFGNLRCMDVCRKEIRTTSIRMRRAPAVTRDCDHKCQQA